MTTPVRPRRWRCGASAPRNRWPCAVPRATLALRKGERRQAKRQLEILLRDPDPRGWRFALVALVGAAREPEAAADVLGSLVRCRRHSEPA